MSTEVVSFLLANVSVLTALSLAKIALHVCHQKAKITFKISQTYLFLIDSCSVYNFCNGNGDCNPATGECVCRGNYTGASCLGIDSMTRTLNNNYHQSINVYIQLNVPTIALDPAMVIVIDPLVYVNAKEYTLVITVAQNNVLLLIAMAMEFAITH